MPVMPPGLGGEYVGIPGQTQGPVALKWDPKNLEIRTTSVERTLEPLVIQVDPADVYETECTTQFGYFRVIRMNSFIRLCIYVLFCAICFA